MMFRTPLGPNQRTTGPPMIVGEPCLFPIRAIQQVSSSSLTSNQNTQYIMAVLENGVVPPLPSLMFDTPIHVAVEYVPLPHALQSNGDKLSIVSLHVPDSHG